MPRWLRVVLWVIVIVVVVVLLFTVVFPRVERGLENPTMGAPGTWADATAPAGPIALAEPTAPGDGQAARSTR